MKVTRKETYNVVQRICVRLRHDEWCLMTMAMSSVAVMIWYTYTSAELDIQH